MTTNKSPLRVGVGGPVGSGKTAMLELLCKALRERYELAVVTNDIYTQEDAQFLIRSEALSAERIIGELERDDAPAGRAREGFSAPRPSHCRASSVPRGLSSRATGRG